MITVKVTYGVREDFTEKNKENIALFMKDFQLMKGDDFQYDVYTLKNGFTFVHISSYANSEIQQIVLNTPSFIAFQKERDESGLTEPHTVEILQRHTNNRTQRHKKIPCMAGDFLFI